jgi:NADH:ubiquinone oxidoreductase subunit E
VSFFTDRNRVRAREIVAQYPHAKSAILPLAHLAQDQAGWLSDEAMAEIAELTDETPANVLGTCSFYTMLKRRPCGRLLVSVCTNVTCLVTGGPEILEHLDSAYAMDDEVDVEEVECIAAWRRPPYRSTTSSTRSSIRARPTSSSSTSAVTSRPARSGFDRRDTT